MSTCATNESETRFFSARSRHLSCTSMAFCCPCFSWRSAIVSRGLVAPTTRLHEAPTMKYVCMMWHSQSSTGLEQAFRGLPDSSVAVLLGITTLFVTPSFLPRSRRGVRLDTEPGKYVQSAKVLCWMKHKRSREGNNMIDGNKNGNHKMTTTTTTIITQKNSGE